MSKAPKVVSPLTSPEERLAPHEVYAIKAVNAGSATDVQQRTAMEAIIKKLCGTYEVSFHLGGQEGARLTDFAEGKRWVGKAIIRTTQLPENLAKREA